MQVYQQARLSNPELRKSAADRDAAFEKINEARSPLLPQLGLVQITPIATATATRTASTLTRPVRPCS